MCVCVCRSVHPEGLPSDYTITLLFRLLPDTPEEPFALWEVLDRTKEPLVGVILDSQFLTPTVGRREGQAVRRAHCSARLLQMEEKL